MRPKRSTTCFLVNPNLNRRAYRSGRVWSTTATLNTKWIPTRPIYERLETSHVELEGQMKIQRKGTSAVQDKGYRP